MTRTLAAVLAVVVLASAFGAAPVAGLHAGPGPAPTAANERPLADAGLDQTVLENATVQLDAAGSRDPDGTIAAYDWTITAPNGSSLAPACPTCERTTFRPQTPGTYEVTLTVTDDDGATATDTLYVDVEAYQPPGVTVSGPTSVTTGTQRTYTAQVTPGTTTPQRVVWRLDGTPVATHPLDGATTDTLELSLPAPGSHTVSATVVDAARPPHSATDDLSVTATAANRPPQAALAHNGTDLAVGEDLRVTAAGSSDPDGTVVSYEWDLGDGRERTGPVQVLDYDAPGTYTIELTVTDDDGATDTRTVSVSVSRDTPSNVLPEARLRLNRSSVAPGQAVKLNAARSSDPNGAIVDYDWDLPRRNLPGDAITVVSYDTTGDYTVTVTVTDNQGGTDTATRTISVEASNGPVPDDDDENSRNPGGSNDSDGETDEPTNCTETPSAAIESVSPQSPEVGDTVQIDASYDGCTVAIDWTIPGTDNTTTTNTTAEAVWTAPGTYDVSYWVLPENASPRIATVDVTVTGDGSGGCDRPLSASIDGYRPTAPEPGETVQFNATATGCYTTSEWSVEGTSPDATSASSASVTWESDGQFEVTYTVTDGNGNTASERVTVSVNESEAEPELLPDFRLEGPKEVVLVIGDSGGVARVAPSPANYVLESDIGSWSFFRKNYDRFDMEFRDQKNRLLHRMKGIHANQSVDWKQILRPDTEAVTVTVRGISDGITKAISTTVNVCRAFSYESCVEETDAPDVPPPGMSISCNSPEIDYGESTSCTVDYENSWVWTLETPGRYHWSTESDDSPVNLEASGWRGGSHTYHIADISAINKKGESEIIKVEVSTTFDFREGNFNTDDLGTRPFSSKEHITIVGSSNQNGNENSNSGNQDRCTRCGGWESK